MQQNNFLRKVFLLSLYLCSVFAIEDYCSVNTYQTNGTHMRFIKEPSVREFAIVGQFKGLHCCVKGYRSIEWYKDGKQYPWPLTLSQLIIYPESANQTVYTQNVFAEDSGNYTCLLRNDSVVHSHTIHLTVFDKVPDDPQVTYISQDKLVPLGGRVRLFCEAFAGRVDLPDAHNEAVWQKLGRNTSLSEDPRIRQVKTSREDGQTFGTYLIIDRVTKEDFGEYICEITKPGQTRQMSVFLTEKVKLEYVNPNPVPVGPMVLWLSALLFLCLTVVILNLRYGLPLRVRIKDLFKQLEENDGKTNDVLIVYASPDSDVVLGLLLPTLEASYGYKCASRELSTNVSNWYGDLLHISEKSRRLIAVLSPAALDEKWDSATMQQAVKQLQGLGIKVIVVTLKEMPSTENEVKNSEGETLASVLKSVQPVYWQRSKDDTFWLSLRLRLPPKRRIHNNLENRTTTQGENSSRLTSNFQDNPEDLV